MSGHAFDSRRIHIEPEPSPDGLGLCYSSAVSSLLPELDSISPEAYYATLDGRRKAHIVQNTPLLPKVGDHVAICLRVKGRESGRIFARVTFVEAYPSPNGDLAVLSLDIRLSTSRMKKVEIPNDE